MPRWLQWTFAAFVAALLVGGPMAYARHRHTQLRNFHVVREGVLYRSAQLSLDGLQRVIYDYRIKTVVTLRFAYRDDDLPPDLEEQEYCLKEGYNHFRLPVRPWSAPDGSVPNQSSVAKFLEIMDNPENYPVLIHCFAGKHRTGAICAIYRMEHDHWSNEQAMQEVKLIGYDNLMEEADVLGYLSNYRPAWRDADCPAAPRGAK
jgi:protein tyrosine/serine phosphatase